MLCPRLLSLYSCVILTVVDGSRRRRTSAKVAGHSLWQPSISPPGGRRRGHTLSWPRSREEVLLHLLALMQRLFPGQSLSASVRTCLLKHLVRPTCEATSGTTARPPPVAAGAVGERSWSRPGNRLMRRRSQAFEEPGDDDAMCSLDSGLHSSARSWPRCPTPAQRIELRALVDQLRSTHRGVDRDGRGSWRSILVQRGLSIIHSSLLVGSLGALVKTGHTSRWHGTRVTILSYCLAPQTCYFAPQSCSQDVGTICTYLAFHLNLAVLEGGFRRKTCQDS